MKLYYYLVAVLTLAVIIQSINITAVHIVNKYPSNGCELIITNDEQLLDLQTNCQKQLFGDKALPAWLQLIDLEKAYVLQKSTSFVGYRYFKNKLNYKYLPQKLTIFEQTLSTYMKSLSFEFLLPFEQSYNITLNFNKQLQEWSLNNLNIDYAFTHVSEIVIDEQQYTIKQKRYTEKTGIIAKNVAIRKLSGKGLHQKVTLKLQLTSQVNMHVDARFCKITIEEILPESSYIDVDQLRSVQHYQVINVEKPEHFAKQYYYRYSFGMDKMMEVGVGKYSIEYSLHFRYPQPSTNNYTRIILHPSDSITLSCLEDSFNVQIAEDPFNDRGFALIFNGSSEDAKIVSMITFILMLLAVMVIARQLRKD